MSTFSKWIIVALILSLSEHVFSQEIKNQNSNSIIYMDQVNSLDELFGKFNGQVIYVDFWASWCSSCLEEFKIDPELETYFKSNNVVRLYIALEQPENENEMKAKSIEKWKSIIEKNNLSSYHYYALLRSDFFKGITEKIMKGKLSLPRFAIVDKSGNIVERNAKRPSNAKGVIRQLSDYLN
jgi:thiol-disulfide isomerase/thioredoxin